MLHPIISYELAKIRNNELLQAAERYRLIQKMRGERPLPLPRLDRFSRGQKPEGGATVSIQTR